MTKKTYVLITPARNEEAYIGQTIDSVVAQSHRPSAWVIVSDGSTDRTDGIAGGVILERVNGRFLAQRISADSSVAGAVQLFRRACYEGIGGYTPIRCGGIDAAAEISARKNGWRVRTFTDLGVFHHRRVAI